jgi:hypothetical protein
LQQMHSLEQQRKGKGDSQHGPCNDDEFFHNPASLDRLPIVFA